MAIVHATIDITGLDADSAQKLEDARIGRDWTKPRALTLNQIARINGPEHLICDCEDGGNSELCGLVGVPCISMSRCYADKYAEMLRLAANCFIRPGSVVTCLEARVSSYRRDWAEVIAMQETIIEVSPH